MPSHHIASHLVRQALAASKSSALISTYLIVMIDPPISGSRLSGYFRCIHCLRGIHIHDTPSSLLFHACPSTPLSYYFEAAQTFSLFLLSIPGTSTSTWESGTPGTAIVHLMKSQGHRPVPRDAWDGDCTPVLSHRNIDCNLGTPGAAIVH